LWNQRRLVTVKRFPVATRHARAKMRGMNTRITKLAQVFSVAASCPLWWLRAIRQALNAALLEGLTAAQFRARWDAMLRKAKR
jgi:hypothetical protein